MTCKALLRYLPLVLTLYLSALTAGLATGSPATSAVHIQQVSLSYPAVTQLVSVAPGGTSADAPSYAPAISRDGRYIAFDSDAANLVPGDTNGQSDVFVYDRITGQIARVSVAHDGSQADGGSYFPAISGDGRYVAFESSATNLVPGDTNGQSDIFVYDRVTGQITRVSVASDGSQADGGSYLPSISSDGQYIAFESSATNLVPADTNGYPDVFVRDRVSAQTIRVSVASDGSGADRPSYFPSISADGRHVAFESDATNLAPDDTNGDWDIFVHDRVTGQTARVSIASDGTQANGSSYAPSITADGRYVVFESDASNLVPGDTNDSTDIFLYDRSTGQIARVSVAHDGSQANDGSYSPSISGDGRYIAFESNATNLVPGDTNGQADVFVYDRATGQITGASVASDGTQANGDSREPSISDNGRYIPFESDATNLVPGDTNSSTDIFMHDALLACPDLQGPQGVGLEDVQVIADRWRQESASFDLDGDEIITVADIMQVAAAWGTCP